MANMLTLGQASKLTGKSKPTISKAVKDGRISGTKGKDGVFQIEASELTRVYPAISDTDGDASTPSTPSNKTTASSVLAVEKKFLEEKVADLEARLEEMKGERNTAQEEARADRARLVAMIEDQRPKTFWQRMTGK